MFCGNCGKNILDGAAFCPNCGRAFVRNGNWSGYGPVVNSQPAGNKKKPVIIGVCCAVAVVMVMAVAVVSLSRSSGGVSVKDDSDTGILTVKDAVRMEGDDDGTVADEETAAEQIYEVTEADLANIIKEFFEFQAEVAIVDVDDAETIEGMLKSDYSTNSVDILGTGMALYTIDSRFRVVSDYDEDNFHFGTVPYNYFRKLGSCDSYYFWVEALSSNLPDSVYTYSAGTDVELICNFRIHLVQTNSGETEEMTFTKSASFVNETADPSGWLISSILGVKDLFEYSLDETDKAKMEEAYAAYADYLENDLLETLPEEYVSALKADGEEWAYDYTDFSEAGYGFRFRAVDIDGDNIPELVGFQGSDAFADFACDTYYKYIAFILTYKDGVVYKNELFDGADWSEGIFYCPGLNQFLFSYEIYDEEEKTNTEYGFICHLEGSTWVVDLDYTSVRPYSGTDIYMVGGTEVSYEDYKAAITFESWDIVVGCLYQGQEIIDYMMGILEY